jgi:hypothetical protein
MERTTNGEGKRRARMERMGRRDVALVGLLVNVVVVVLEPRWGHCLNPAVKIKNVGGGSACSCFRAGGAMGLCHGVWPGHTQARVI